MDPSRSYLLGARLSGLLINVGSACLHRIFEEGIMTKFSLPLENGRLNLTSVFTMPSIKETLVAYNTGKGKPRLIRKEQWELLYPESGEVSSQTFDLTLLTLLIRILELVEAPTGGWFNEPSEFDTTQAANINRLRTLRNQLYGHISNTAYTNKEYKVTFKELERVLLSLGADSAAITEWDNKFGNTDEKRFNDMQAINQQLTTLVQTDLHDIQELQKNLIKIVDTLSSGGVEQQYQSLVATMEELKSDIAELSPSKVLETFLLLQNSLKGEFSTVSMQFTDLINRDESFKMILLEIKKQLLENAHVQQKLSEDVNAVLKGQQEVRDKLDTLVKVIKHDKNNRENSENILPKLFDYNDWRRIKDPFRILIITSVSQLSENELSFKRFGEAVGLCPWQIVIDLDPRSQSSDGLFDFTNETIRKHMVVQVETYKSTRSVKELDKEAVVKGEKMLWMQANGSEILNCEPCLDFFGKSVSKIQPLLDDILVKFPLKRPFLCVVLLLTNAPKELHAVQEIGRMIGHLYDCQNEQIDIESSNFCIFADQDRVKCSSLVEIMGTSQYMEWKRYSAPLTLLSDFFIHSYGRDLDIKYNIPCFEESIGLSEEDFVQLKSVMELYHKDIGKINFEAMPEQEYGTKLNEIKYRYLKGNVISPEALCLHEDGEQMYVVRSEMKVIKAKIREELQRRNKLSSTNTSRKGICLIEHDTSGGGTTCGRYLLFSLRTEYPCLEVKQFGTQLLDWLKIIYSKAQIPLLLLIDNLDCQTSDVITLQRFLENKRVKALVVHIKRKVKQRSPSEEQDSEERIIDIKFDLNSHVIATQDKVAFKKLYETNEKKAFTLKVFMFGLYKFLEEYDKLVPLIENCISNAKQNQLQLMRAILYISKYVHNGVNLNVALKLLNENDEDIERSLGSIADFLVCDNMRLRTANDCFIEPFLSKLDPVDIGTKLELFMDDILAFSMKDSEEKRNSFDLICSLFIRSRKIDHRWTEFIEDLEETHDKSFVTNITEQFLNIFEGVATGCPHLRTFYARYLMHKINNNKLAIQQIRIALSVLETDGICSTSVTDVVLLSTYGHLHRDTMKHKMKEDIAKYKKMPEKMQLDEIFYFASEAVQAFEKAQNSTKTSLYDMKELFSGSSFYFEANTRYMLLNHIYTYKCGGNHAAFTEYLGADKQIVLVKESLPRALRILQALEYLMVLGRVDLDAETSQKVTRTKFDLLQLLTDEKISMKQKLSRMPDKLPCDFGYFMLYRCAKTSSPREWRDLPPKDLRFIIDKISQRIQYPEVMLRTNYRDIIRAMIYLRQLKQADNSKFNIKLACEYAVEWVKYHPKDLEAHFMLGFLRLLEAIIGDDVEAISVAKRSLETCKKLCKDNPSMPAYCHFLYNIGCGEGLEKAIPYEKTIAKPLLMEFVGRKVDANCVAVRIGRAENALKVKVVKCEQSRNDEDSWSVIQKQRLVTFNLAIALDRISAINLNIYDVSKSTSFGSD